MAEKDTCGKNILETGWKSGFLLSLRVWRWNPTAYSWLRTCKRPPCALIPMSRSYLVAASLLAVRAWWTTAASWNLRCALRALPVRTVSPRSQSRKATSADAHLSAQLHKQRMFHTSPDCAHWRQCSVSCAPQLRPHLHADTNPIREYNAWIHNIIIC